MGAFRSASPRSVPTAPHLDALLRAALDGRVVEIEYSGRGGVESRPIQPIGIVAQAGFWYCHAYCFSRGAMRLFRVDRVSRVSETDEPAPRDDLVGTTLANVTTAQSSPNDVVVRLRLSPEGARLLGHWPGTVLSDDGTGHVMTTTRRDALPFLARHLLALGREALVESPPELALAISRMATEVADAYRPTKAKRRDARTNSGPSLCQACSRQGGGF